MYFRISSEPEKTAEPESAPLTEDLCTKFLFKIYFSRDLFLQGSAELEAVLSTGDWEAAATAGDLAALALCLATISQRELWSN